MSSRFLFKQQIYSVSVKELSLIVVPQKFDVLKTNICPRSPAARANILVFKNINFNCLFSTNLLVYGKSFIPCLEQVSFFKISSQYIVLSVLRFPMLLQIESETGLIRLTKQSRAWGLFKRFLQSGGLEETGWVPYKAYLRTKDSLKHLVNKYTAVPGVLTY